MDTPAEITARKEELFRFRQAHLVEIEQRESELRAARHELSVIEAQIAELDFAIEIYAGRQSVAQDPPSKTVRRPLRKLVLEMLELRPMTEEQIRAAIPMAQRQATDVLAYWKEQGRIHQVTPNGHWHFSNRAEALPLAAE